jgi:hypothetical protein
VLVEHPPRLAPRAYTLVNAINIADGTELIAARNATTS